MFVGGVGVVGCGVDWLRVVFVGRDVGDKVDNMVLIGYVVMGGGCVCNVC